MGTDERGYNVCSYICSLSRCRVVVLRSMIWYKMRHDFHTSHIPFCGVVAMPSAIGHWPLAIGHWPCLRPGGAAQPTPARSREVSVRIRPSPPPSELALAISVCHSSSSGWQGPVSGSPSAPCRASMISIACQVFRSLTTYLFMCCVVHQVLTLHRSGHAHA